MSEPKRSRQARRWPADLASPALFALAGLAFLILPVAESSCGDEELLVQACLNGAGLLTGEPVMATKAGGGDFPAIPMDTIVLPGWLAALAIGVLLCVAAGMSTAFISDPKRRSILRLSAALAGLALGTTTYVLAVRELSLTLEFTRALFSTVVDESVDLAIVITGIGIVPTLGLLGGLAAVEAFRLLRMRTA